MTDRPAPVSPEDRLYRIVEDGMCIGCGLCESMAGADNVRIQVVANGYERPVVVGDLDHETVDQIYDVCPGTRLEGLPERLVAEDSRHDLVWGPYQRMVEAHATDPEIRHLGSTGGVLTALGLYLIETGEVASILHATSGGNSPTFGQAHISRTREDVLAAAGSRYGPTAVLTGIHEHLDRDEPFAFIGKPCDVAALRNLARHDQRVDRLCRYMLTMVCGGFMPPDGMANFLDREGIDASAITNFRYRGNGCPGPTRVETADGQTQEFTYTDLWGTDETQWMLPFRCKVCPDGIGEAADIAAADNWPGGSPDPETEHLDPGTNAVVLRTQAGMRLAEAAVAAGYLTIARDVDPRHMDGVQPHQRNKKLVVRARWDGLAAEGRTVPRSARLRLDALGAELDPEFYAQQRDGTSQRVRDGKTTEPKPSAG